MGRLPRPTGDDLIYHAINRGNNRADVLGPDGERDMFLGDLARTKARYPFALFGYCLMSNHFHLLLKPAPGQSISRILQSLTVAHTWRHHRRQGTSGHVWQGRFRSPVVQEGDHLFVVLRYIEANPVRAAMVADPCEYTWSSHRCHGAGGIIGVSSFFGEKRTDTNNPRHITARELASPPFERVYIRACTNPGHLSTTAPCQATVDGTSHYFSGI